jgi:hypothetical protein
MAKQKVPTTWRWRRDGAGRRTHNVNVDALMKAFPNVEMIHVQEHQVTIIQAQGQRQVLPRNTKKTAGILTATYIGPSHSHFGNGYRNPQARQLTVPLDAWMYFLPKVIREAFWREWVEEREMHRAAGRSNLYIRATLWSQLFVMFVIGGKDRLLALARKLWAPS